MLAVHRSIKDEDTLMDDHEGKATAVLSSLLPFISS